MGTIGLVFFTVLKLFIGIKLGDIGPLFGNNATNNGYLQLSNVHIPRDHMLMKHAKVCKLFYQ